MIAVADARVRRAMLLMEQSLASPLSAERLAAAVPISKRQLERLFRTCLGASIQSFGRDLRLCYAVWLMIRARGRLGDIAAQCGFADAPHFSRSFRSAFGAAPSEALREGPEALRLRLDGWWRYGRLAAGGGTAPLGDRRPYS
jgi:transcriptional regulator GlxA family with amidase domain